MTDIIAQDLKRMFQGYLDNRKLCDFHIGTYTPDGKVMLDQNIPLPASVLVIPQQLTDWEVDVELKDNYDMLHQSGCPGGYGDCTVVEHKGKVKLKIYNHINPGDRLILLKKPSEDLYLVLGRVA